MLVFDVCHKNYLKMGVEDQSHNFWANFLSKHALVPRVSVLVDLDFPETPEEITRPLAQVRKINEIIEKTDLTILAGFNHFAIQNLNCLDSHQQFLSSGAIEFLGEQTLNVLFLQQDEENTIAEVSNQTNRILFKINRTHRTCSYQAQSCINGSFSNEELTLPDNGLLDLCKIAEMAEERSRELIDRSGTA